MSGLVRHRTNYGAGKVHLVRPSDAIGRARLYVSLYCTGRGMSGTFRTDDPVECKACLKRAKREGVEA
jgi:hypothetical protein